MRYRPLSGRRCGLPDDDDRLDELGDSVEDVLDVETLLGWDGDPCECSECECPRFRDGAEGARCPDCRAGSHWPGAGLPRGVR